MKLLLLLLIPSVNAIICYNGLKLISGGSVGQQTEDCPNSAAYCYNMTANAAVVIDVVKAGCSMWRCMLAKDRCISTTFQTIPISLCCCSTDRCNVGENYGLQGSNTDSNSNRGWNNNNNEEPQNMRRQQWTNEQVASKFGSAELDDDAHPSTPRGNRHGGSSGGQGRDVEIP